MKATIEISRERFGGMSDAEQLLPCPFCGGKAHFIKRAMDSGATRLVREERKLLPRACCITGIRKQEGIGRDIPQNMRKKPLLKLLRMDLKRSRTC